MSDLISAIRPYVEILYFAAGVLLLAGLIFTYKQILLIARDIKTRKERAAAEKAVEAAERYLSNFVSLIKVDFDQRKADKTGFKIIGRTFCSAVENENDRIAMSRKKHPHSYWANIVALYALWRPRLSKAELDDERRKLEQRIDAIPDTAIPPIGKAG